MRFALQLNAYWEHAKEYPKKRWPMFIFLRKPHGKTVLMLIMIFLVTLAVNWNNFRSGRAAKIFINLSTPYAGEEEVLPAEVLSLVTVVRQNNIKSLGISEKIMANRFISSPIIESIYPTIVTPSSKVSILYLSEEFPNYCSIMKQEKGIRLVNCP